MAKKPDEFDFDDDDFSIDDDEDAQGFEFDDELGGLDEEEDFEDLGDFDTGLDEFDLEEEPLEEGAAGGGPNRTFIILAVAMIVLFVIGLIAVLILATRPTGPTDIDLSVTARVAQNATIAATATEGAIFNATFNAQSTQTAEALAITQTALAAIPKATFPADTDVLSGPNTLFDVLGTAPAGTVADVVAVSPDGAWFRVSYPGGEGWVTAAAVTVSGNLGSVPVQQGPPLPTPTSEPTILDQTAVAATQLALNQLAMTQTAAFATEEATPTADAAAQALAVQQTATALAQLFQATPTAEIVQTPGGGVVVRPTALPETGLFDDVVAGGSQTFGAVLLVAFGLVGVIFVSRRLRAANSRS